MSKILYVDPLKPETNLIKQAVEVLRRSGILVYPTDTVCGLGGDALNPGVVRQVFKIKGRALDQPLPVAVSGLVMAKKLAFIDEKANQLTHTFWPGALTIVVKKRSRVPSIVVSGGTSVGLRMPNHAVPLMLLELSGCPLIATSANLHGKPTPLDAGEALKQLGEGIDLVLDGGRVQGQSSTIIDLTTTPPSMIRNGPVTREMIQKIIGYVKG